MLAKAKQAPAKEAKSPDSVLASFNPELLKALHILTRDGQLNQDSRRKLKQVKHLLQFITPLLDASENAQVADGKNAGEQHQGLNHVAQNQITLVDHGAGKSYLGFMLWDAWFASHGGQVIGIEVREELVKQSKQLANQFGFSGMHFLHIPSAQAQQHVELPAKIDVVTALHACDSATDDALSFGLQRRAEHIVLVPCCQAEVAGWLRQSKAQALSRTALSELWRHPIHTREFGAQITNVMRCLRLEASGYKVTVTELVGWEHSMKNELIVASRHSDIARGKAKLRLAQMMAEIGLSDPQGRFAVADDLGH